MKLTRVLLTSTLPISIVLASCGGDEAGSQNNVAPSGSSTDSGGAATSSASNTSTSGPQSTASTGGQTNSSTGPQGIGPTGGQTNASTGPQSVGPTGDQTTGSTGPQSTGEQATSESDDTATSGGTSDVETSSGPDTSDNMGSSDTTTPGTVNWGKEEDPSAGCEVTGDLPSYGELTADGMLPDPFMKLDGTRITSKSEWACRRAEIIKQLATYIYGEKPIPAKGSVSGTVSTTRISVQVSGGQKDAAFDVTVDMNGATAPAPAIISYGGGAPVPDGVAKITLTAIESQGGSGGKNGPFFDYYGNDHPAGYMVAQAWQVSRIIDLLEQNPETFDPSHIGVTGCSRNGKGAFAGGVFDNRIALTIACESGIGGAVALRLKEQLDPGANNTNEWPYHAISYVRWLSEVALGPFATANDAAGDNTDRLPVDMHQAMALIAPRAVYIVDNPGLSILDPKSSYVSAMAGKAIFEALGVGDHFAYEAASGGHCQWRPEYQPSLDAMIDRFLKGNDSAETGSIGTDLGNPPDPEQYYTWDSAELSGEL